MNIAPIKRHLLLVFTTVCIFQIQFVFGQEKFVINGNLKDQATGEASQKPGPGTDERANMLRRKEEKQVGQFVGAVVQGRRYDDKTGKQVKAKKK